MRSAKLLRRLGKVMLALGLFLVAFMGIVTAYLAPTLLHPGVTEKGSTFTGTEEQGRLALALFGIVMLFGINAMTAGILQIRSGQRNTITLYVGIVLLVTLLMVGWNLSKSFSG